ncbi:hypothetical protein CBS147354_3384 [Penicillium roqueforti]|nr:hypothetical protein CBS147354_3384 [Penicillium roqueforti]
MKKVTASSIPQRNLQLLRIDLYHLDIASGITSPSVTHYFMPRRGNYGKGTYRADALLRRVFMDYQDCSIPELWPYELDGGEEEDNYDDPTVHESGHLDSTGGDKVTDGRDESDHKNKSDIEEIHSDKAKEGESMNHKKYDESEQDGDKSEESGDENRKPSDESHDKSEKEADHDHEMVIANTFDLDILNYETDDWSVYWFQRLYGLDLPDKIHGINITRSMEIDHPYKSHAWALVDVTSCGYDRPSAAELIALVSWGLRGMFRELESLVNALESKGVHRFSEVFPTMIIVFDQRCCARVLYAYFDGRFQVQFTPVLNFKEFTEVKSFTLDSYMGQIDRKKYYDMMHSLLRWAWPLDHYRTSIAQL